MKRNFLNKAIAIFIFGAIVSGFAFGNQKKNVKDIVPPEYYDELMENGKVLLARGDGSEGFLLLPESKYSQQIIDSQVKKEPKKFPFTYEGLYYLSKADILKASNSDKTDITINDVAKVCRSVSKMEGMKYYSNSRKREEILYKEVYMISEEGLKEKYPEPIPDQNEGNADGQVSYCLQNDASFGRNKYKLSYFQSDDELFTQFVLMDKMGKFIFEALYPEKMKINLLVIDCGDDLLLYLCTDLDSVKFPGIGDIIVDSMTARMEAVYNWFLKQF